ncbi:alpha/beta fold hydrolase [Rhodobacter maris]|uniref:Pimeloyl-ACP methyl ester carboxylesterase n=1 Tax=Rhodobacter maris TaxID=446682 RepID=A0A285RQC0_9RHOB|nr:alpha/beta hydrolase [Rhodobacter maris]SOB94602.1 pimeloyl-ACP methyl ester carboxylesterase [Rhodobacter maris]
MKHFIAEDGARLAYRDEGAGLPLLALAGLTRDGRDFDYLAHHLPPAVRLIRLDSRGRGGSDWTGADSYTVAQEARDALALLDHLGLARAAVIGSSRGGLLGMVIAATAQPRLAGLCLNDVGPVLERDGLVRISQYVGLAPSVQTLEEAAERLAATMSGFDHVPPLRWEEEAMRHYRQLPEGLGLTYDPALRMAFEAAMAGPPVDLWPLFDACAGVPLALIRGARSDLLSAKTAAEMCRRRPDMTFADVPARGHIPFLDEPAATRCIGDWLARVRACETQRAG